MVKDIARLGIVNNKSLILKGPNLTNNELRYLSYILRGIIDGDGTLGFPSNCAKSMYFRIVSGSEAFIDWCIWALEILGMKDLRKRAIDKTMWEVNSAQASNIAILNFSIYPGEMGMKRKSQLIKNHFNTYSMPPHQVTDETNPVNCGELS